MAGSPSGKTKRKQGGQEGAKGAQGSALLSCPRCFFSEIPVRFPCRRGGREGEPLPQTPPLREACVLEFSIRTDRETSSHRRGWSGSEAGHRLR